MSGKRANPVSGHKTKKLENRPGSVNLLWLLAFLGVAASCGPPRRPVPVEPRQLGPGWLMPLGNAKRSPHAGEEVPEEGVAMVWERKVGRGLLAPLIAEGPILLATAANGRVAALSATDGRPYWDRRIDRALGSGLTRHGDTLFVASDWRGGRVFALELRRGRRIWAERAGPAPFAPLLLGDTAFVATADGQVVALRTGNGRPYWRTRLNGAAVSPVIPHGDGLLVATASDTLYLLARDTGEIARRRALPGTVSAPPALVGDTIYLPFHTGELTALLLPTLDEVWRAPFGAPILAAPVAAPDGSLFVLTRSAEVWRVPPGGRAGERLASLDGAARGSLTLARNGLLVGRLDGTLFLLRHDGSIVWQERFDDAIAAPVTVHDGAIYVPLLRGRIVKLRGRT